MSREAENNHCPELCEIRQMKQKKNEVKKMNSCFSISEQEKEYLASEPEKAQKIFKRHFFLRHLLVFVMKTADNSDNSGTDLDAEIISLILKTGHKSQLQKLSTFLYFF